MANVKVTAMTELTAPADGDLLYCVDDPGGSPLPRKLQIKNLLKSARGEIKAVGASGSQTLTSGVYDIITQFATNGVSKNCTNDQANDKITITNAGDYLLSFTVSFTTPSTSVLVEIAVFHNAVITDVIASADTDSAGERTCLTASGYFTVAAGAQDLTLRVKGDSADSFDVKEMNLRCERVID